MTKRIFMAVIAFVMVLCTTFAFAGCGSSANNNSTTTPSTAGYMVIGEESEGGKVYGSCYAVANSNVKLFAVPDEGYRFDRWSDGNTNPERKFNCVNQAISLTAYFKPVVRFVKAEVFPVHLPDGCEFVTIDRFYIESDGWIMAEKSLLDSDYYLHKYYLSHFTLYPKRNYEFDKDSKFYVNIESYICYVDKNRTVVGPVVVPAPDENTPIEVVASSTGQSIYEYTETFEGEEYGIQVRFYFE